MVLVGFSQETGWPARETADRQNGKSFIEFLELLKTSNFLL